MKTKKRSVILLIASILSTGYLAYILIIFAGAFAGSSPEEQIGAALATAILLPHLIAVALGSLFCWLGFGFENKWLALVGAILFCAALVLFFWNFYFTVPLIVLAFIGFVCQGKLRITLSGVSAVAANVNDTKAE